MTFPSIHRVVTGHDDSGKAVVSMDGPLPTVIELAAFPGTMFHEVWNTSTTPAPIGNESDPTLASLTLPPPKQGTRIRFVDIPPEAADFMTQGAAKMKGAFAQIGDAGALTANGQSAHPMMHRTETVDYGIVIEGEITLVLDDSEVPLKAGSVVIQRGTNHAWANRSSKPCRILFILVDGMFDPVIAEALSRRGSNHA